MRTRKQIAASRRNGRKSRGATTPEGKARIVDANLRSGVFAETVILACEREHDFHQIQHEYYVHHPSASTEARRLLDRIATCEWRLRRFLSVDTALWKHLFQACPPNSDPRAYAVQEGGSTFSRLQYRINSTRRAFSIALHDLERFEAGAISSATPSPQTRLPNPWESP